jgi:hypothetical protein
MCVPHLPTFYDKVTHNIHTMRIHLTILAAALSCSATMAQTNQEIGMQGKQTSFTSRGTIGSANGELFQAFHASHHNEMAATVSGTVNDVTVLRVVHQDQNCATNETWDWVIRSGDDTNGPLSGTPGILGEVTGLNLPNSTVTTPCAWGQTLTLAATARINLPVDKHFALGIRLTPSANWTMDGHSVHTSFGSAAYPHQNSWTETNATLAQSTAWNFVGTATMATQPSNFRTFRLYFRHHGIAMQLGCGGAYGTGGLWPLASTASAPLAYTARIRGGAASSGGATVAVLAPAGLFPVAVPFGDMARLRINPAGMLLFYGPAANPSGESIVPIAPFIPTLGAPPGTMFPFQGAVDTVATGIRLSNTQWVEPQ